MHIVGNDGFIYTAAHAQLYLCEVLQLLGLGRAIKGFGGVTHQDEAPPAEQHARKRANEGQQAVKGPSVSTLGFGVQR